MTYSIHLIRQDQFDDEVRQQEKDKLITTIDYIDTVEGEFTMIISSYLTMAISKRVIRELILLPLEDMNNDELIQAVDNILNQ